MLKKFKAINCIHFVSLLMCVLLGIQHPEQIYSIATSRNLLIVAYIAHHLRFELEWS